MHSSNVIALLLLRKTCAALHLLLLLALPAVVNAQGGVVIGGIGPFIFATNNGVLSLSAALITAPDGAMVIPSTFYGLPVVAIENSTSTVPVLHLNPVFPGSVTSVTIPNSITNIGSSVFVSTPQLTAITVDPLNSRYSSLDGVLFDIGQTTVIQFPSGKGGNFIVPSTISIIENTAFQDCSRLRGIYFPGDAPGVGPSAFAGAANVTAYYLAGTTGWGTTFGGMPAVLYDPLVPFTYTTNNGTITITGYTGLGGAVTIPDSINGGSRHQHRSLSICILSKPH